MSPEDRRIAIFVLIESLIFLAGVFIGWSMNRRPASHNKALQNRINELEKISWNVDPE